MAANDNNKQSVKRTFVINFVGGMGWALGISAGFAALAVILTKVLSLIGGLPLVGNWFADIIIAVQQSLLTKH